MAGGGGSVRAYRRSRTWGKAPVEAILAAARRRAGRFSESGGLSASGCSPKGLTSKSVIEMLIKTGAFASIHRESSGVDRDVGRVCRGGIKGGEGCAAAGLISLFAAEAEEAGECGSASRSRDSRSAGLRAGRVAVDGEGVAWVCICRSIPLKPFEPELRPQVPGDAVRRYQGNAAESGDHDRRVGD